MGRAFICAGLPTPRSHPTSSRRRTRRRPTSCSTFDKSTLKPQARTTLLTIAAAARKHAADDPITVDGHTDAKGSPSYNLALPLRRAEAVRDFLVQIGGIDARRITVQGYGESVPVAPNTKPDGTDNPAGRAKNRRVVITVHAR